MVETRFCLGSFEQELDPISIGMLMKTIRENPRIVQIDWSDQCTLPGPWLDACSFINIVRASANVLLEAGAMGIASDFALDINDGNRDIYFQHKTGVDLPVKEKAVL